MVERLRVESNERLDLQDFEHIAGDAILTGFEQILGEVFTSPVKERKWILDGFAMTNPSGNQVRVDLGRAILGQRRDGAIRYGVMASEGDAAKIQDIASYIPGTYGIFVRFEEVPEAIESRIFWNPAGDGQEYTQTIPTRYVPNWSIAIEVGSPGAEWLKIGEVDQASMVITDQRDFYFEGSFDGSYESGWSTDGGGSADDRDPDRTIYGVKDLQTFTAATRQCLEDIKGRGLRRWYERDIGGMNVGFDADPVEGRLAVANEYLYLEKASPLGYPTLNFDLLPPYDVGYDEVRIQYNRSGAYFLFDMGWSNPDYLLAEDGFYSAYTGGLKLGQSSAHWGTTYVGNIYSKSNTTYGQISMEAAAAPTNEKLWYFENNNGTFRFSTGPTDVYYVTRTGTDPDTFVFANLDSVGPASGLITLGTSGLRWGEIWGDEVDVTLLSAGTVATDLIPDTGFLDLGSVADKWREIHAWDVYADDLYATTLGALSPATAITLIDDIAGNSQNVGTAASRINEVHSFEVWNDGSKGINQKSGIAYFGTAGYVTYTGDHILMGGTTYPTVVRGGTSGVAANNTRWLTIFLDGVDFYIPLWPFI